MRGWWRREARPNNIPKRSLLEPITTQLVEWTGEHSQGLDWWWGHLDSFGQWFNHQCSDSRVCGCSFFGCWSLEQPAWWYPGHKWFGRSNLLALGLHNHKGSGRRSLGYDKVTLVIPDSTEFGSRVLVTLGTPTINQIINVIKKSEINELSVFLNESRIAQLLACWQAELSSQKETVAN